jgi:hypothetical protein
LPDDSASRVKHGDMLTLVGVHLRHHHRLTLIANTLVCNAPMLFKFEKELLVHGGVLVGL